MERAARGMGQAQSRLLAMASQFNRALQQVDRQRVTLGTTGITSTLANTTNLGSRASPAASCTREATATVAAGAAKEAPTA